MAKNNSFLSNFYAKLKKIKHIEVYAILILGILLICIWLFPEQKENKHTINEVSIGTTTTIQYANMLETRLNQVLSAIEGAGSVQCMITLNGEIERVLAYADDEKTSSTQNTTANGTTNKTETSTLNKEPILIKANGESEPLVLYEIMPEIKGIVVVASGANNVRVKLDILKAVQALLKVESSQIEIFLKVKN